MSVVVANAVRIVSSFGSDPYLLIDASPSGPSTPDALFSRSADSPGFFCLWNGQFIDGARSIVNCNLAFDPLVGNTFLDAQPGPGNANRADCEIGFHGGSFPIVRTHRSDTGVFGLLFFDDGSRAPPGQLTLANINADIANIVDPAVKSAVQKIVDALSATVGVGLFLVT